MAGTSTGHFKVQPSLSPSANAQRADLRFFDQDPAGDPEVKRVCVQDQKPAFTRCDQGNGDVA